MERGGERDGGSVSGGGVRDVGTMEAVMKAVVEEEGMGRGIVLGEKGVRSGLEVKAVEETE